MILRGVELGDVRELLRLLAQPSLYDVPGDQVGQHERQREDAEENEDCEG